MKRAKIAAIALGLLVAIAALTIAGLLWSGVLEERLRLEAQSRAAAATGAEVSIGRLEIFLLPPTVRLREITVRKRGNRGSSAEATIQKATARAGLLTFLGVRRGPVALEIDHAAAGIDLAARRPLLSDGGDGLFTPGLLAILPAGSSLKLTDGAVTLGYQDGPRCHLEGIGASLMQGAPPSLLIGHLGVGSGEAHGLVADLRGIGGEVDLDLTPDRIRLDPLSLRAEGIALSGRLQIALGPRPAAEGEIRVGGDAAGLSRFLPAGAQPAGRLDARLSGRWGEAGIEAQGDVSAMALRVFGLQMDSLRAELELSGNELRATAIKAHLMGGEATGSIDTTRTGAAWTSRLDARVDGVDLAQLVAYAGWTGPALRGTVHYRGAHTLDTSGPESLRGSGLFEAVGHYVSPRGIDLPLEVTSNLLVEGTTIRLSGGTLRAGSVRGSFSGSVAPGEGIRLRLKGATGDIAEILPLFAKPAPAKPVSTKPKAAAPGTPTGEAAPARPVRLVSWAADPAPGSRDESPLERLVQSLGGRWEWDGDLSYNRRGLSFDGRLAGTGLTLLDEDLGSLEAQVLYRDDRLTIRDATLHPAGGGGVTLRGTVGFGEGGTIAVEAVVTDCPIAPFLRIAGKPLPIEARVSGRVGLGGRPSAPAGHATFESGPLSVAGLRFDALKGEVVLTPDLLEVHGMTLSKGAGSLRVDGRLPYVAGIEGGGVEAGLEPQTLSIAGQDLDLSLWSPAGPWAARSFAGRLTIEGSIGGALDAPEGTLSMRGEGVELLGAAIGPLRLDARLAGDRIDLDGDLPASHVAVEGTIGLRDGGPAELRATLAETEARGHIILGSLEEARAVLSGQAEIRGPLLDWRRLSARLSLGRLSLEVAGVGVAASGPVEAALAEGRIHLSPVALAGEGTAIEIAGALDPGEEGAIDLSAKGRFDLRLMRAFLKNLQATGQGTVEVRVTGSRSRPVFHGSLAVAAEAIRYPDLPFPINDLEIRAIFDDERMRFETLRMQAGGGPVEGSGEILLGAGSGLWFGVRQADVRLRGQDVKSQFPEGFQSTADLDFQFLLDREAATLHGTVDLVRGVYGRDFRVASTVVGGRAPAWTGLGPMQGPLAGMQLDLKVRAPGEVWLRNDFGTVEAEGELHVTGSAARPAVAGRITAHEGGWIRFRGVRYQVEHGTLDFADPDAINPLADLVATTSVAEYQVSLHIEGTADNFKYDLSSTPPLPQQDIVALLLTGHTLGTLSAGGRLVGEETVSAYLSGRIGDELTGKLGSRAGLDLLSIDPLVVNGQGDPTTRLTIGKQVTPDLYVTYSNDLGSTLGSIYQLDYALSRDLKLTSVRDRDGSIGGDLRYVLLGKPPAAPGRRGSGPAAAPDRPRIRAVRLEGGDPHFKQAAILRRLRVKAGRRRDRAVLNDGIERLLAFYRRRQFLMAEVDIRETPSGPGAVDLLVRIKTGPRIAIEFEGRRHREGTRQKVAPYWEKGIFLDEIVESARARIASLFRDRGYQAAEVEARVLERTDREFRVRFAIHRGPRTHASEVRIAGARLVPEEDVRKVVRTRASTGLSRGIVKDSRLRDDVAAIRALYLERGFTRVAVDPAGVTVDASGKRASIVFPIREGPKVLLHAIRIEGARTIAPDRLERAAGLVAGAPHTAAGSDAALVRVRRALDDAGFYDARVRPRLETVAREGDVEQADLILTVEEGIQATVRDVNVEGNLITREKVVRNALTVKPGDPLSRSDLLESQRRLYQRSIFTSVAVEPVAGPAAEPADASPRQVARDVAVSVREAAPLSQVFGLGYNSEERARAQYEIADRNIFGSGRYLGLQMRGSDLRQSASILYRERGILGGRFDSLGSGFEEYERRPGFDVRTIGASVQIGREVSRATKLLYRYSLRDVDLSNASPDFEGTTLRLSSLAASAVHDTRDSLFEPLKGHYLSGEIQYFGKAIGSEAEFVKMYAQVFYFREVLPKTVWAQALRAGVAPTFGRSRSDPASTGDDVSGLPPTERFFAGGDTTIRGFRRDHVGELDANGDPIGGEGLFLLNEELRFPIFRGLQAVVFYDAGNVYRRVGDYDVTDLRHVAGAGLRLATPIGPFRLEYGAILDRRENESPGEFFFSIGQAF